MSEDAVEVHLIDYGDTEELLPSEADEFIQTSLKSLIETAGFPDDCDQQKLLRDAMSIGLRKRKRLRQHAT